VAAHREFTGTVRPPASRAAPSRHRAAAPDRGARRPPSRTAVPRRCRDPGARGSPGPAGCPARLTAAEPKRERRREDDWTRVPTPGETADSITRGEGAPGHPQVLTRHIREHRSAHLHQLRMTALADDAPLGAAGPASCRFARLAAVVPGLGPRSDGPARLPRNRLSPYCPIPWREARELEAVTEGQLTAVAGSLGCSVSGVVWVVIHGSSGSDVRIACSSAGFRARHSPSARDVPGSAGSAQSRTSLPCWAS
jgi:hypothetical protein